MRNASLASSGDPPENLIHANFSSTLTNLVVNLFERGQGKRPRRETSHPLFNEVKGVTHHTAQLIGMETGLFNQVPPHIICGGARKVIQLSV